MAGDDHRLARLAGGQPGEEDGEGLYEIVAAHDGGRLGAGVRGVGVQDRIHTGKFTNFCQVYAIKLKPTNILNGFQPSRRPRPTASD